jgi:RNA polymerase sigma factor (sigma-70 family)
MLWFKRRHPKEAEFRSLIDRYAVFVRATLKQIDHKLSRSDLEELEQDVRIKLWHSLVEENCFDRPASYIKKVVSSVAIDAARKRLSRGGQITHVDYQELTLHDELAAHVLEHRAELMQLAQRLEREAPEGARVLGLYLQGFSTEEIGQLLDFTEAKARNILYRFLAELRGENSTS